VFTLDNAIDRAFDLSTRSLNLARDSVKAVSANDIIADSSSGDAFMRRENYHTADAQYRANRNWVYCATDLLGSRVAGQQVRVSSDRVAARGAGPRTAKAVGDDREPLDSHPVLDLLARPNELMDGSALLYATTASIAITGRSLWWVNPNTDGGASILPIPTSWIIRVDNARKVWTIRLPGERAKDNMPEEIPIPGEQTVLFNKQSPSDPWGCISTLAAISEAVTIDEKISETQWRLFEQGIWPQVAVKAGTLPPPPGTSGPPMRPHLTPEQRQQLVVAIRRAYRGSHRLGEPLIIDGMIDDVIKLSLTPSELDFGNSGKIIKSKILQAFRCSPILLGEVEGANRASATVADEVFCSATVNPCIAMLSKSLTRYLGPMFAKDGERLTIWIEPCQPRDAEGMFRRWQVALAAGAVTINEFRRNVLNLPPIDGGDELLDEMPTASAELVKRLNPYTMQRLT